MLSALQTFLNYSTLAERHKIAATRYGMLRREIEQFLDDPDEEANVMREFMHAFRERWAQVEQESPMIPQSIHEKSQAQLLQFLSEESKRMGQSTTPKNIESHMLPLNPPTIAAPSVRPDSARLLLVRGLPGSGKTTIAKSIPGFVHLEADQYFEKDGKFNFQREKLPDAHAWCLQRAKEELGKY